jgi:ribose transport system permease protein
MTLAPPAPPPVAENRPSRLSFRGMVTDGSSIIRIVTVVLFAVACFAVPSFATASNLRALFLSVALVGVAAVGLSLITIVGRLFSLSISATIATSTIVFAYELDAGPWLALLAAITFGVLVGAVQGMLVGRFSTDPIVTTIAVAAIVVGIAQIITGGRNITGNRGSNPFGSSVFGVIPAQVFIFFVITAIVWWLHRYSRYGRVLSLIGLNEKAAVVSGLRTWPTVLLAFTVSGALAGLAGGLLGSESGQGNLQLGATFGFDAITAVVVGGISVKGGQGSPLDAAVGAVFVGLLGNTLILLGLSYEAQLMVKGALVLTAVVAAGASASGARTGRTVTR